MTCCEKHRAGYTKHEKRQLKREHRQAAKSLHHADDRIKVKHGKSVDISSILPNPTQPSALTSLSIVVAHGSTLFGPVSHPRLHLYLVAKHGSEIQLSGVVGSVTVVKCKHGSKIDLSRMVYGQLFVGKVKCGSTLLEGRVDKGVEAGYRVGGPAMVAPAFPPTPFPPSAFPSFPPMAQQPPAAPAYQQPMPSSSSGWGPQVPLIINPVLVENCGLPSSAASSSTSAVPSMPPPSYDEIDGRKPEVLDLKPVAAK
ncbi:hypothetical protein HDV00_012062 [Rhizophlyctis rosea]|nr:hypothetical protein HDV00_012062 [Rhizophlyctis rosea]